MQKYTIELMKYTEAGAPTSEYSYDYADTPQGLAEKMERYSKMHYAKVNEETGESVKGLKMYKVTPKQAVYQEISDFVTFVEVNGVQYHG